MTMLLFARPLLSAITPLLAATGDTTLAVPPVAPDSIPAASATLASVVMPSFGFGWTTTPTAVTAYAAPAAAVPVAAAARPAVVIGGRVPMPEWALGARTGMSRLGRADSIVVEKAEHRMTLYAGGESLGTFLVAIGKQSVGAKERAGDLRTPEGLYHIDGRNPNSRFHLALHVSYPNAADMARARRLGVSTGGDIMIHGLPNGQGAVGAVHRDYDWTNGCVAVTDAEIEQIWNAVPIGTPIRIKP